MAEKSASDKDALLREGARLRDAATFGNGMDASRVLEEVGSCNWTQVLNQSRRVSQDMRDSFRIEMSSELRGNTEKISVFRVGDLRNGVGQQYDNRVVPLASVEDTRCDKKAGK